MSLAPSNFIARGKILVLAIFLSVYNASLNLKEI